MLTVLFEWLESTRIGTAVGQSLLLTGLLSAIHLLGLTLLVGGAAVAELRLLGLSLRERPVCDVTRPLGHGMILGLVVSVASGLLLFAPRASTAAANGTFQWKMLLLLAAAVFHFTLYRRVTRLDGPISLALRLAAALGPLLWFGVAVAGSAYILLE